MFLGYTLKYLGESGDYKDHTYSENYIYIVLYAI